MINPCKNCGKTSTYTVHADSVMFVGCYVVCDASRGGCRSISKRCSSIEKAISDWNRTNPTPPETEASDER